MALVKENLKIVSFTVFNHKNNLNKSNTNQEISISPFSCKSMLISDCKISYNSKILKYYNFILY